MTDVVICTDVHKTFRASEGGPEQQVLRGVSCTIRAGERVAIVGPSGCGKSTLLNLIGGLDRPTSGSITVCGQQLSSLSDKNLTALRNHSIGFVFQDHHLLPQATVLENVLMPCLASRSRPAPEEIARGEQLLAEVGLADRAGEWPQNLSGGQRQRVALARSLIMQPKVLLADEPTGSLDRATAEQMTELLLSVQSAVNTALIVVTHSGELAAQMGRILRLDTGVVETAA